MASASQTEGSLNSKSYASDRHLLRPEEHNAAHRSVIELALADPRAQIPACFQASYLRYQYFQQRHSLIQINYITQLVFLLYYFADMLIIPDMQLYSASFRLGLAAAVMSACFFLIRYKQNILWADIVLPIGTVFSMGLWIYMLLHSNSPWTDHYLFVSVIFILIANMGVQVTFKPAFYASACIALIAAFGAAALMTFPQMTIFALTFSPICLFSLYISWNNTLNGRRSFLRTLLDEWYLNNLNDLAHTDELTQLYNRRQFVYAAEHKIHEWPTSAATCLLMFDVDHFKKVNDTYGHDVGDQVLQIIANTARKEMRHNDILARFGGEEFIVLIPETQIEDSLMIAERIRQSIAQEQLYLKPDMKLKFTVSIGVAQLNSPQQDLDELIKQADIALYQAKERGRNRVVRYDPSMSAPPEKINQHPDPAALQRIRDLKNNPSGVSIL
ncbi:GGDEF domain-containing protein [Acinetobacter tianfuensis]|uniref:diguanylate cyclase n=1 Tax=Acinetobacter tianfuensis TaxID=2419603 RepID=A0A3A8EQM6_9GAMM|nr:GGDEF domain-containing protein [Acinetobacter tianfuensis]RKG30713.1 GGDEF domain-containing protein [Acinetobacter tianfuensis]